MSPHAECPPGHPSLGHNVPLDISALVQTFPLSAVCPSCQAGEGTNGRKKSVWSVKYKRELPCSPVLKTVDYLGS